MWIYLWPQNVLVSSVVQWFEELEPPRIHKCEANIILHNSIITCLRKNKLKCLAVFCARRFGWNSWRSMYVAWPSSLKKSWIIMGRAYRSWLFFITLSVQVASNLDVCFGKYIFIWLLPVSMKLVMSEFPKVGKFSSTQAVHFSTMSYCIISHQIWYRGSLEAWIFACTELSASIQYTQFIQSSLLFCKVLRHFVMVLDHSYFDIQRRYNQF